MLFREGLFLRAYNESCYILTELLGHNLKIHCQKLRRKDEWIVMCAFPANKLSERLPKTVFTDFGGQLASDFELTDYRNWLERRCREESIANAGAKAENETLKMFETSASEHAVDENLTSLLLPLTKQQIAYLQMWQKGQYPIEVDLAFIESLKTKLAAFYR